jgi:hypothetical protein
VLDDLSVIGTMQNGCDAVKDRIMAHCIFLVFSSDPGAFALGQSESVETISRLIVHPRLQELALVKRGSLIEDETCYTKPIVPGAAETQRSQPRPRAVTA